MNKTKHHRLQMCLALLCIVCLCWSGNCQAAENVLGLDDTNTYDLYIAGEEGLAVISSVEVIGFRDIQNITFLVFQGSSFNSKKTEGLVALEAIRAVLPTNRISPISVNQTIRAR